MLLGLRTVVYHVTDLGEAKSWYSAVLDDAPYFDEPFYVGFDVGGFELGLVPADEDRPPGVGGVDAYWGVDDIDRAVERLVEHGADVHSGIRDVGDGIRVATVLDPFGNVFGVIENPHFGPTAAGSGGGG